MISSVFKRKNKFPLQSFTYYIPAPPKRKYGYQEKEFDEVVAYLNSKDFEVVEIKTQGHQCQEAAGMWIICLIRPLNQKALKCKLNFEYALQEEAGSNELEIEYD